MHMPNPGVRSRMRKERSGRYGFTLKKAGAPVEMHLYADGGHAFGIRRTSFPITDWPQLVERWLKTIGVISDDRPNQTLQPTSVKPNTEQAADRLENYKVEIRKYK